MGTAWLAVLILVVYSIAFYDPTLDPFSANPKEKLLRPNPVDMLFYKAKLKLLRPAGTQYGIFSRLHRRLGSSAGRDVFVEVRIETPVGPC